MGSHMYIEESLSLRIVCSVSIYYAGWWQVNKNDGNKNKTKRKRNPYLYYMFVSYSSAVT